MNTHRNFAVLLCSPPMWNVAAQEVVLCYSNQGSYFNPADFVTPTSEHHDMPSAFSRRSLFAVLEHHRRWKLKLVLFRLSPKRRRTLVSTVPEFTEVEAYSD